jgi:hypothetical protein
MLLGRSQCCIAEAESGFEVNCLGRSVPSQTYQTEERQNEVNIDKQ